MFVVSEIEWPRSRVIGTAPTEDGAKALLPTNLLLIEADADNPGCWDAMSADMRQFTIEPAKNV